MAVRSSGAPSGGIPAAEQARGIAWADPAIVAAMQDIEQRRAPRG